MELLSQEEKHQRIIQILFSEIMLSMLAIIVKNLFCNFQKMERLLQGTNQQNQQENLLVVIGDISQNVANTKDIKLLVGIYGDMKRRNDLSVRCV